MIQFQTYRRITSLEARFHSSKPHPTPVDVTHSIVLTASHLDVRPENFLRSRVFGLNHSIEGRDLLFFTIAQMIMEENSICMKG